MSTEYIKTIKYRKEMETKLARDFWFMCTSKPDFTWGDKEYFESCFLLECGNGWLQHIYNMCRELLSEIKSNFSFTQIKQKYGTLNVYHIGDITPYGEEIIKQYEKESKYICECCGEKGKLYTNGWCMTLCNKCYKESQER